MLTETKEFASKKGLILKMVTKVEFCELAVLPAFPYDNPDYTFLRPPFMYSKSDNVTSAWDVTNTYLYYCIGKP